MNATPLTVIALAKAKPGREAALRAAMLALIPTTRQEPGCLNYDLHESADRPGEFMFHENWTSRKHLDDHLARPHLQAFLKQVPELVSEPPQILLYNKIG